MRILHGIAIATGLCLGVARTGYVPAGFAAVTQNGLVAGRLHVPPDLVPRIANSAISNLYGVPLGTAAPDGSFALPPSPLDDIEIVFVKAPASDEVIVMGYADGDTYEIGVEGTALALLLMANPANASLDVNAKRALFKAARAQPDFVELTQAIQHNITNHTSVTTASDSRIVGLLAGIQAAIQASLPRPPAQQAANAPLQNNY